MANENPTSPTRLPEQLKKWYIGKDGAWSGPYTVADVVKRVREGLASWVDFLWAPEEGHTWRRIASFDAFQEFLPPPPPDNAIREIQTAIEWKTLKQVPNAPQQRHGVSTTWFLQFEGSEFGPLTFPEIRLILSSGKLKGRLFAWREGMTNWKPVDQVVELQEIAGPILDQLKEPATERRRGKRASLVASVRYHLPGDKETYYTGVCRDISAQGLGVLSNRLPDQGVIIRLEVSPLGSSGIPSFVVEAEVLRLQKDKQGFSLRFTSLPEAARVAIERYLSTK